MEIRVFSESDKSDCLDVAKSNVPDYFSRQDLIDFKMVDVKSDTLGESLGNTGSQWAEPSATHLRQLMRGVFIERDVGFEKGLIARNEIHASHDRVRVTKLIMDRIKKTPYFQNIKNTLNE